MAPVKLAASKRKRHVLYLVRHAIAAERGPAWPDDAKRPLTSKGISRMRDVVRGLRDLDVAIDVILTSPLVRAKQTAEILAEGLRPTPPIAVVAALSPGVPPVQVIEALGTFRKMHRIALVGHEPGMGELAAWLIGAKQALPFKKGGVARIDIGSTPAPGQGELVWMATPKMLRK
jgi:phosphohistidine phosphatase